MTGNGDSRDEYRHGYQMGYDYCALEGGVRMWVYAELKRRGIPSRTSCGVGFVAGAKDASDGKGRKYRD